MKKIPFYLWFLFMVTGPVAVMAQSYQSVYSGRENIFIKNTDEYLGFRVDSSKTVGGDTLLYPVKFPRLDDAGIYCYKPFGTSWLGDSIRIRPDGLNIFYFGGADSVVLQTQAGQGQSWVLLNRTDGSHVDVTVTAMQTETVAGANDSVKILTLQARDAAENPVTWSYNGSQFKLSKDNGIIRMISFYQLLHESGLNYEDYGPLTLVGCNNPFYGVQNTHWRDIYTYAVGDEFLIEYYHAVYYSEFIQRTELVLETVLSVNYSTDGDTAFYLMKRCGHIINDTSGIQSHTGYEDTVQEMNILVNPVFNALPYECAMKDSQTAIYSTMFRQYGRPCKAEAIVWYTPVMADTCWNQVHLDIFCMSWEYQHYVEGCGGPYYEYNTCSYSTDRRNLRYYKKGSETFGTPYSCESVVNGLALETRTEVGVHVYPNPMLSEGVVEIADFTGVSATFILYDQVGRVVHQQELTAAKTAIPRGSLKSGLYLYRVISGNGEISQGKWMIE